MKIWVTNWQPYSIPHSAINCFNALGFAASLVEEHPTMSHQPYNGSSSGAKVINLSERTKSIHTFFF
jgi:hypothetical protein